MNDRNTRARDTVDNTERETLGDNTKTEQSNSTTAETQNQPSAETIERPTRETLHSTSNRVDTPRDAVEGLDSNRANSETDLKSRSNPLVTVVITTYNRPEYLESAIESVQHQTYEPIELVVVDDHSDTPVESIVSSLSTDHFEAVEYIRHDQNRGANAARNTGLQAASGEYIAFLDDDDRWVPTKIARQVVAFERHDDIGVTYTGLITINNQGSRVAVPEPVEGNITKALLCRNIVGTLSSVMVRADVADAVPFNEAFPSWADLEWYINLSTKTKFHRIPDPLVVYEYGSHNRLSEDFEKKRVAYHLFLREFDTLAAQFGRLFRRKMRAWAAFRLGSTALTMNLYSESRRLQATALREYPFEPRFFEYFLTTVGGRYTHELARSVRDIVRPVP